tara:strand:+ start:1284 stop:3065 length:1782 start_codon:yes stop_codon:yes gene_type:complete
MANRKISQFTELTAPAVTDVLPIIDQSGTGTEKNKKITYSNLLSKAPNGSESAPSFSFLLDPNSGISGGSDTLTLSTNGQGRLVANSSGLITIPGTLTVTGTSTFSDHIDLATGKVLKVNGTEVLSATAYTGNAATATVLATARTIGGVSFNGSANIDLPGVNTAGNQNTTGNAATATALANARTIAGVSFDGTANISLNNNAITNGASYVTASIINSLDASNLSSGTIPDARFPATLPAASGVNLTSLNASNLASGTVAAARLSTATTQTAGNNTTKIATTAFVSTAISNLINGAPAALDTLNELAAAMADDAAFSTTVTNNLATKLNLSGGQMTGNLTFSGSQTVDGRDLSVDGAKLDGIQAGATADQTASEILTLVKTVDGTGSGLDADLLDGQEGSYYRNASNINAGTLDAARIPTLNQDTTGSAATLTTARTINGVSFDGSADITVTAAGSTLTGTSLKSTIVSSSLTSVGTLTGLTVSGNILMTGTGAIDVAAGTTAQRPGSPNTGMFRYNSTTNQFEGYTNAGWGAIAGGGAGSGATLQATNGIVETAATISSDHTVTTNFNAMSAGPVTVSADITIPSGSVWTIV